MNTLASSPDSFPKRQPNRRDALKAAFGVGYAASVLPTLAQSAIHTPANGLTAGAVRIEVNGFQLPAYRAAPSNASRPPVVLVIQEIFGVHEYIADICRRLAHQGYLAIAPELYARQGDPRSYSDIAQLQAELVSKVPDAQVLSDLDACAQWAVNNGGHPDKLGVTGFCWGGRQTWLFAAHQPKVKAAVAWYGRLVGAKTALTPQQPVDLAQDLRAPVLGLYGEEDGGIPLASVAQMQEALKAGSAAARQSSFVLYKNAGHAFHADYRPSYREAAATDGWKRALDWFKQYGVA